MHYMDPGSVQRRLKNSLTPLMPHDIRSLFSALLQRIETLEARLDGKTTKKAVADTDEFGIPTELRAKVTETRKKPSGKSTKSVPKGD